MKDSKLIQGVKNSRQASRINHLFYANDLIVFFKTITKSCNKLSKVIVDFGKASRLLINQWKSELLFGHNTPKLIR